MPRIKILPEILSNKIAAGEVVERPASVVKEVLENSLDAGATHILIEIGGGGRTLIRVSDNGRGMDSDDAMLAIERYATSKIQVDSDLFAIGTLGFRGEALPSIASVSRFTLISRPRDQDEGIEIKIAGGKLVNVSTVGAPPGTMVEVRQLFYNTPARRKFLKTINTELGHISDTVVQMAMGWPQVHFELKHNSKTIKLWPTTSDPAQRVAEVLGRNVLPHLFQIQTDQEALAISGWLASSKVSRSFSKGLYLYVNGRFVRDRMVQHAVMEAYRGRLMKGRFPVGALFIKVPADQVDVNVHPTKHEVRFADSRQIHDTLLQVVREALIGNERPAWQHKADQSGKIASGSTPDRVQETPLVFNRNSQRIQAVPSAAKITAPENKYQGQTQEPPGLNFTREDAKQSSLWKEPFFSSLALIGQLKNAYLVCEDKEGLILIDQHAVHERIRFETLRKKGRQQQPASQMLLMPETVELGYAEAAVLEAALSDLNQMGIEIEPFGGNTFVVKAIPVILSRANIHELIKDVADKLVAVGSIDDISHAMDACRIVMACHRSIRAHQALNRQEIMALLNQLDHCEDPAHCPHGRPTWIRIDLATVEKRFGRTGNL